MSRFKHAQEAIKAVFYDGTMPHLSVTKGQLETLREQIDEYLSSMPEGLEDEHGQEE